MEYTPKKVFVLEGTTYLELSYAEFRQQAVTYQGRWFLPLHGMLMEVSEDAYKAFYKDKRRQKYLNERSNDNGDFSYDMLTTDEFNGEDILVDEVADTAGEAEKNLLLDKLRQAITLLSADEQRLLHQLFNQWLSERTIADMYSVSQVAIHMLRQARTLSSEETSDLTQLENIWYEGFEEDGLDHHDHYNRSRYYALNLHSTFYRGTVEWRCFNSTLHAGKVAAYVNLCLAISAQAIAQRSTVMRKTHSENELFTFRVWLVRLGLNGDEFKHTRDHLLAHLEGDRAWRHDKDSYEVNRKKKCAWVKTNIL